MAKEEKKLFIHTEDSIPDIVAMYLKKIGMSEWEPGYSFGFIIASAKVKQLIGDNEINRHLVGLLEYHFYAGIHYALTYKDKIEYKMLDKKDFIARLEKLKTELKGEKDKLSKLIKPPLPSYLG